MIYRKRLAILSGLVGLVIFPKTILATAAAMSQDCQDRRPRRIRLITFLDIMCPGWVMWEMPGLSGHGVFNIPGYGDMTTENILVNGDLPEGLNVETIILQTGETLQIGGFAARVPEPADGDGSF